MRNARNGAVLYYSHFLLFLYIKYLSEIDDIIYVSICLCQTNLLFPSNHFSDTTCRYVSMVYRLRAHGHELLHWRLKPYLTLLHP